MSVFQSVCVCVCVCVSVHVYVCVPTMYSAQHRVGTLTSIEVLQVDGSGQQQLVSTDF